MDVPTSGEVRPRDASAPLFGECSNEVAPPLVSPWGAVGRLLTLGVVSAFSKFVVSWMNRATVSNYDTLHRHMTARHRPQGLITVSNHASTFDDPGVLSYLIPFRYFMTEPSHGGVRWTMCTKAGRGRGHCGRGIPIKCSYQRSACSDQGGCVCVTRRDTCRSSKTPQRSTT
jgi:hypothetical protein